MELTKLQDKCNDQRGSVNSILKPLKTSKSLTCTDKMKKEVESYRWRAEVVGRRVEGIEVGKRMIVV